MKSLIFGAVACGLLMTGAGFAQTPGTAPAGTTPAGPAATTNGTAPTPARTGGAMPSHDNQSAASGNNNQAVATTGANAPAPAKGANSFTMGEAKSRLEKNGFASVGDLTKDDNGVWRGSAQKGGAATTVWLDYKGNVGESK
jgi:hypothetical protein